MDSIDLGNQLVVISFHKDYSDCCDYMKGAMEVAGSKMKAYMTAEDVESFLVD